MNIPEGQRLIMAWLDTAVELQQILDRNPGIRRIYLITTDSALPAPEHPAVRALPLLQRHKLPDLFADDRTFFSEGRVSLYFGTDKITQHSGVCRELQTQLLQFTQRHLSGVALRATRGWHILANELCNLPLIRHSQDQLSDVWKNDPVLIVGAGPSLDDTVPAIKRYRNRIRLIACDGAWNTLTQQNITPDLVVTTDDSHKVWRYFDVPKKLAGVPVAALLQSCCHIARHHQGPVFFARNGRDRDDLLASEFGLPLPILDSGLCCGHATLAIARQMGARQIIMTGFDLGYKDGRFHPHDQPLPYFHQAPPPDANRLRVESNEDGTIETELSMLFYRQEFERRVAGIHPPVINATAGGARIAGTRYESLEKILSALPALQEKPLAALRSLAPPVEIGPALTRMAHNALNEPAQLIHAPENRSVPWRLIAEAVNPALCTGVTFLTEDVQRKVAGAEEELNTLFEQLQQIRQQLLEIIHSLAQISWPRKRTRRAFSFIEQPDLAERVARARGLELIAHDLDPDNLPVLWHAIETEAIDTLIMENGGLLPAAWSMPGLQCLNVCTRSDAPPLQTEHQVPGFIQYPV